MAMVGVLKRILFCVIFCLLGQCYGLTCKHGYAVVIRGQPDYPYNITNTTCLIEQEYCVFGTCIIDDSPGFVFSGWQCAFHNDETYCAEKTAKNMSQKYKSVHCKCEIGEQGKDMANDKPIMTLPPPKPTSPPTPTTTEPPNLICMRGTYDEDGYGTLEDKECDKGQQFCYLANCKTDMVSYLSWGCAKDTDCAKISADWTMNRGGGNYSCECTFGAPGLNLGNEKLHIPMARTIVFTEMEIPNSGISSCNMQIGGAILWVLVTFATTAIAFNFCFSAWIGIVATFGAIFVRPTTIGGFV